MNFNEGDPVEFPDPLDGRIVTGTFLEVAVDRPIQVPGSDGVGTHLVDAARVKRDEDSTVAVVRYTHITPAK